MNKSKRPAARLKAKRLKRTLPDLQKDWDAIAVISELETFKSSRIGAALKSAVAEEAFKYENALRSFVRKTGLGSEAAYAAGALEALEWVGSSMMGEFIEFLKSGHAIGVSEDARPEEESKAAQIPSGEG